MIISEPDKTRFIDNFSSYGLKHPDYDYLIAGVEVSNENAKLHFISVFVRQGSDEEIAEFRKKLPKSLKPQNYHNPNVFHSEGGWHLWTKWGSKHCHIVYDRPPTKEDVYEAISSASCDPEFINEIKSYYGEYHD